MRLLCVSPRCRILAQHAPGCETEGCAGCLPRYAADGRMLRKEKT